MRLVIHTQYYPPEMGAPQARLSELARHFAGRGHKVYVLTAMPNYPGGKLYPGYRSLLRREESEGISIIRTFIYPTNSVGMVLRLANYLSFVFSSLLIGAFILPRADFLITESPPLFLEIAGWLLARLKGARWILNVSDLWLNSLKDLGILRDRGLLYRMLQGLSRFLNRRAWLVTGQSKEIIAEIRRQVPSGRLHHLSNGVDTHFFHPDKRDERIRRRFLKPGEVGFVYAGLHGFFQGLDQILRAAAMLRDEPIRFVFLGDGSEKESMVTMASDLRLSNVDFHPPVPRERISSIIASMDVALIPLRTTIRGSVPSKIYEAMASGVPVLLAANGEAREIVEKTGAGIAVAPGDVDGLSRAIQDLALQPERRRRMGEAGRRAAENFYERTKISEEFEAVLLGGKGP
jgi:colanic acid biosynthesis glycosyl transferase WcaI